MENLKETLGQLEKLKTIEKVTESANWINPLVLVRKPDNKLRICLDPMELNTVIKREYATIPTIEQITSKLANATIFSKLNYMGHIISGEGIEPDSRKIDAIRYKHT
uniref:Reverse transcriptase domain-containing protein n=1 Tax=Photinus pyralis TaxID=7054 RepID=A0A1Y1MVR2_PHOPY